MRMIRTFSLVAFGALTAISCALFAQQSGSGLPGGSNNSTQYRLSATAFGGTGPGTAGQVLTSNGAGSAPTFQTGGVSPDLTVDSLTATDPISGITGPLLLTSSTPGFILRESDMAAGSQYWIGSVGTMTYTFGPTDDSGGIGNGGLAMSRSAGNTAGINLDATTNLIVNINGSTQEVQVTNGAIALNGTTTLGGNLLATTATFDPAGGADELTVADGLVTATNLTVSGTCTGCGAASPTDYSFTITWDDACTTSPTTAVVATQTGNIVAWRLAAVSGGCSSDSANYATTTAIVPSAIRPATDVVIMQGWANDTGVNTLGCIVIDSTGTVAAYKDGSAGCVGASWLNAGGTKSYGQNGVGLTSFSYRL